MILQSNTKRNQMLVQFHTQPQIVAKINLELSVDHIQHLIYKLIHLALHHKIVLLLPFLHNTFSRQLQQQIFLLHFWKCHMILFLNKLCQLFDKLCLGLSCFQTLHLLHKLSLTDSSNCNINMFNKIIICNFRKFYSVLLHTLVDVFAK